MKEQPTKDAVEQYCSLQFVHYLLLPAAASWLPSQELQCTAGLHCVPSTQLHGVPSALPVPVPFPRKAHVAAWPSEAFSSACGLQELWARSLRTFNETLTQCSAMLISCETNPEMCMAIVAASMCRQSWYCQQSKDFQSLSKAL